MSQKHYVFWIRPAASRGGGDIPREWALRGTSGRIAALEASSDGWRIFQRSWQGFIALVVVGIGVGLVVLVGVFVPTAYLIVGGMGPSLGSGILWAVVAYSISVAILIPIVPYIWKFAAWRPHGPFVDIRVMSLDVGLFRHELRIWGDGRQVLVRMNGPRWAVKAAIHLAQQKPRSSEPRVN